MIYYLCGIIGMLMQLQVHCTAFNISFVKILWYRYLHFFFCGCFVIFFYVLNISRWCLYVDDIVWLQPPLDEKLGNTYIIHFTYGCDYSSKVTLSTNSSTHFHIVATRHTLNMRWIVRQFFWNCSSRCVYFYALLFVQY